MDGIGWMDWIGWILLRSLVQLEHLAVLINTGVNKKLVLNNIALLELDQMFEAFRPK